MTIGLTLAYAAVAALLLNLGVASQWSPRVKAGVIALVSVFYGTTYLGLRAGEGWPTAQPMPEDFRLHWLTIDEPDKRGDDDGAIYLWLRALDGDGIPVDEPRSHVVPYGPDAAEQAREALDLLQGGKRLNGYLTRGLIDPAEGDLDDDHAVQPEADGSRSQPNSRSFEFREVPPPDLPPKPALAQ